MMTRSLKRPAKHLLLLRHLPRSLHLSNLRSLSHVARQKERWNLKMITSKSMISSPQMRISWSTRTVPGPKEKADPRKIQKLPRQRPKINLSWQETNVPNIRSPPYPQHNLCSLLGGILLRLTPRKTNLLSPPPVPSHIIKGPNCLPSKKGLK